MAPTFAFSFRRNNRLPKLAWCLSIDSGAGTVEVILGPWLEFGDRWFAEGAWAGDFGEPNFAETVMTGTGGKITDHGLLLVTPTHTLDRVLLLRTTDTVYASNSLPFLLTQSGETLDPECIFYDGYITSVKDGTRGYCKQIPCKDGHEILPFYFVNVLIDSDLNIQTQAKPSAPEFASFADYRAYVTRSAGAVATNAADVRRRQKFHPLTTISRGYDSPAATVIAKEAGCQAAFTFRDSRNVGGSEDCGAPIARQLGLDVEEFGRLDYLSFEDFPEIENSGGPNEFVSFGQSLSSCLLFSGFHGDKVWDKHCDVVGRDLVRGDASGSSFTELRLRTGFLHLPVPFIGAENLPSIFRISNSAEMRPWFMGNNYDRPIARRIVEEAGIARDEFGQKKYAAGVAVSDEGLDVTMSPRSLQDFDDFVHRYWTIGKEAKVILAKSMRACLKTNKRIRRVVNRVLLNVTGLRLPRLPRLIPPRIRAITYGYLGVESYLFHWGVKHSTERYERSLSREDS